MDQHRPEGIYTHSKCKQGTCKKIKKYINNKKNLQFFTGIEFQLI